MDTISGAERSESPAYGASFMIKLPRLPVRSQSRISWAKIASRQ